MKKHKPLSPEERFKAIAKNLSPDMSYEERLQFMVAFENLKLEFPEWSKKNELDVPSEFEIWREIVDPDTFAEVYYGMYYYSGLQKCFDDEGLGKPEQYLRDDQILKLISKYLKGKK
jgi:hypothetical protein